MVRLSLLKSLTSMLFFIQLISCGSQAPMVSNVEVQTTQQGGDVQVSLAADLNIGNLQLPIASFPIFLPKTGRQIGLISLGSDASGINQMVLDINVSEAANLQLASVQLPNGTALPIIGNNAVLVIPAGKIQVYLSLLDGAQALGVAIPVKTFDSIGAKIGTSALMPIFSQKGVIGAAGIYTSSEPGKNGFALVADISSMIDVSIPNVFAMRTYSELNHHSVAPSRRQTKRINRELYRLHRKRKLLELF